MSGTKAGAKKAVATVMEKHGDDFYKRIGKIGGSKSTTGGFYSNHELARVAGAKGGSISKRNEAASWYENNKNKIDALTNEGYGNKAIANALGVKLSKIYYVKKNYGGEE